MSEHPAFLTTSGQRARIGRLISDATGPAGLDFTAGALVADIIDLMTGATLIAAGVADVLDRRRIATVMFREDQR